MFFLASVSFQAEAAQWVARVNGDVVTQEEFLFYAGKYKHTIIAQYRNEHQLMFHSDFWNDTSTGYAPAVMLKELTMDSIVVVKLRYQLARKVGIIGEIDFEAIKNYMQIENEQRRIALDQNRVIYGPEQYRLENYVDYLTSNVLIKLNHYFIKRQSNQSCSSIISEELKRVSVKINKKNFNAIKF